MLVGSQATIHSTFSLLVPVLAASEHILCTCLHCLVACSQSELTSSAFCAA